MRDKEKLIIETSMKLFAKKSFALTSIQEIAQEAGIAKGSFYSYFKSKDDLLLAILQYYYGNIQREVSIFNNKNLNPREKFCEKLTTLLQNLLKHKEFIIMQSREQAIPLNEEVKKFIYQMHIEIIEFYRTSFLEIFGEDVKPYVWDLSIMMDGIFHSYFKILMFENKQFDLTDLANYMFKRIEHIFKGLTNEHTRPMLSEEKINSLLQKMRAVFLDETNRVNELLTKIKAEIENVDNKEELTVSLEVVEEEFEKKSPRLPVIQGMLSNFRPYPQFHQYIEELIDQYHKDS